MVGSRGRVENAGSCEGVAGAPADHLAAGGEIEIAGGESGVGFLYEHLRGSVGVCRGEADEAGGEGEAVVIADAEGGLDEDLVEDLWRGLTEVAVEGGVIDDGEGVAGAQGTLFGGRRILRVDAGRDRKEAVNVSRYFIEGLCCSKSYKSV